MHSMNSCEKGIYSNQLSLSNRQFSKCIYSTRKCHIKLEGILAIKVNLDAMIPRADFATHTTEDSASDKIATLAIEQLRNESLLVHRLRKPDFQRETNHWTPGQLVVFLKSYLENELVPSVILWQSPSHLFVIDGGHRISALRAWVEDDYGDGHISQQFYNGEIPEEQKRIAKKVRNKVSKEVGSFKLLGEISKSNSDSFSEEHQTRAKNMVSRALSLQWVVGNAEVAETSFFKINTQGTPLDKIEERLLRQRRKPIAISARSIVRAGHGHKYWSKFDDEVQHQIESVAAELNKLLFKPEITEPIKTLNLPLGGKVSPIGALNLLMDFIEVSARGESTTKTQWGIYTDDIDGLGTLKAMEKCLKILRRATGNHASSLGLHPAVYFYNQSGKHSNYLFLAIISCIAEAIKNNNSNFFKKFINAREKLEKFLITNKPVINQAIVLIGSQYRVARLQNMFSQLIEKLNIDDAVSTEELLSYLKLKGKVLASDLEGSPKTAFSNETKSSIYLKTSLDSAIKCPVCNGLIDTTKSVSYDHKKRVQDGGTGNSDNVQLTHPYCNSAIKN